MITGFFGDIGSGKTLTMTKYGYFYHLAGYKIYSNYGLSFPHEKIDSEFLQRIVKENPELPSNTVFLMDEFDMFADSREGMKKRNKIIGYFIKQVRKKNIKFLYACQMKHTIDKRIRGLTRTEVFCESKDIVFTNGEIELLKIKIIYNEIWVNHQLKNNKRFVANPFYPLYDTKELIILDDD